MRTEATVVELKNGRAIVESQRLSACEGCHKQVDGEHGCSVCSLMGGDRAIRTEAENPIGARVGDRVVIESRTGRMLLYAALVFLLPIVAALCAYGAASLCTTAETVRLTVSGLALICAFFGVFVYSKGVQKKRCDVEITEIVRRATR